MVGVQPLDLVLGQDAGHHRRGGDGHKGQRAEGQEGAVLVVGLVVALQLVLDADADDAALVDARLVGDDHARLEHGGVAAVQSVGAFVDIAHEADAVAGAAAVIDEVLPQRLTGDGIQHVAVAVVQPDGLGNVDMALQRPGVEPLFVLGQLAQRVGAGDVGGAVHVGRAAVHQQKALLFELGVVFLGGMVVHHGRITAVGRNGAEALHDELVLCRAVLVEDLVHGQLRQLLACGQTLFQLLLEPHHGHGIAQMGLTVVVQLGLVLDALHRQQGVGLVLDGQDRVVAQGLIDRIVDGSRVGQNGLGLGLCGQEGEDVVIFGDLDAIFLQLSSGLRAQTTGVDEEDGTVPGHIAVGHGIGSALDVHRAEVQQPGQVVQLAHQLGRAAQLLELGPQLLQLLGGGKARILLAQEPGRGLRQGRAALGPQLIFQIQGLDGAVLGVQRFLYAAHQLAGSGQAAQAQHTAFRQGIGAVLLHGGHTRLAHPFQLDLGARNLLFGLHKIAAVGPQGALVSGHDEVRVLAVEAGEIGQGGVVVGQILAGVRVAHRDEVEVHAIGVHGGAQRSQTLRDCIHAHDKSLLSYTCRKNVRRRFSLAPIVSFRRTDCNCPGRFTPTG